MKPQDLLEWYKALAPIVLGVGAFLYFTLPILGRLIATWRPRAGEAFIRAGGDIGGAIGVAKLEPGTPSVSAQPLLESSAAVAASKPSVRPPPDVKPPSTPPAGPAGLAPPRPNAGPITPGIPRLLLVLLLVGCSGSLTPAQSAGAAKIPGAVCDVAQGFTDAFAVKFICSVIASGAISNMSTGPGGSVDARPEKPARFEVIVPKEQASAFAKEHGAPQ